MVYYYYSLLKIKYMRNMCDICLPSSLNTTYNFPLWWKPIKCLINLRNHAFTQQIDFSPRCKADGGFTNLVLRSKCHCCLWRKWLYTKTHYTHSNYTYAYCHFVKLLLWTPFCLMKLYSVGKLVRIPHILVLHWSTGDDNFIKALICWNNDNNVWHP